MTQRIDFPLITSLTYDHSEEPVKFGKVVSRSLNGAAVGSSWCEECAKYQTTTQARVLRNLPEVLLLNFSLATDKDRLFLTNQQKNFPSEPHNPLSPSAIEPEKRVLKPCRYGEACNRPNCRYIHAKTGIGMGEACNLPPSTWIPPSLALFLGPSGSVSTVQEEGSEGAEYELKAGVFVVREADSQHLISCIRVTGEPQPKPWILFNEFVLCRVSEREAIQFSMDWKVPCLVCYVRTNLAHRVQVPVVNPIDESVFRIDESECLAMRRRLSSWTFVPLEEMEIPRNGALVAIDTEFVTLNQEEAELKSDGTKTTTKPSQMSLARVTCIRGDGEMEGVPFIDDYISTPEEVADYLTQFSGIKPGDLDPHMTSKHLTTLKSTYLKLRFLADNGVLFIGHGLINDFRVINIVVPQEQIVDTVHLFHLPHHRMVSLRFLAWYFLEANIQSETHDSVEDAKTALKLYKKYREISLNGHAHIQQTLAQMYERGHELEWKVPENNFQ